MWGDSDPLFPSGINKATYDMLRAAYGMEAGAYTTEIVKGRGHATEEVDFYKAGQWLKCTKDRNRYCPD
jgi:hypothetical protein